MGFSTEQIQAALGALDIDSAEVLSQLSERDTPEYDRASVEHAALVGLLYRKLATELRDIITGAPTVQQFMDRHLAVSPQNIEVSGEDRAAQSGEHDATGRFQVPTLHGAISQAAEATKVLLQIHRDRHQEELVDPELEAILFDTVDDRLQRCIDYVDAARYGVATLPLSDDTDTDDEHQHPGFDVPADIGDPLGRPVDNALLGRFIGAAYDGCTSCQDALLTLIVEDAATTARLVELACVATQQQLGGLPAGLLDEYAPGPVTVEFRRLARAGLGGAGTAMFDECARMTAAQRRAAANTAADILIGQFPR